MFEVGDLITGDLEEVIAHGDYPYSYTIPGAIMQIVAVTDSYADGEENDEDDFLVRILGHFDNVDEILSKYQWGRTALRNGCIDNKLGKDYWVGDKYFVPAEDWPGYIAEEVDRKTRGYMVNCKLTRLDKEMRALMRKAGGF